MARLPLFRNLSAFAGALAASFALAQTYPAKPVHLIIPNGTGAPPDILARALAPPLSQALGQPVVVDNRVGANGIVAVEAVVRAPADCYTLCVTQGAPISLNPFFYAKLPYEPLRDLAPIANIGVIAATIIASTSAPVKSMRELVEWAKQKPSTVVWGTWGSGSFSDLYRAWAESTFGVSYLELPYKTSTHAFNAVMSGEAHVMLNASGPLPRFIEAGKIRGLATIGPTRYRALPEVVSFFELGYDVDFRGWVGVLGPAATPRDIATKLNGEINRIIADEKFAERFLTPASIEARVGTPEEFAAFLKADRETAGRLMKLTKVKPQ
jgi:tripartite-type tricarboxylate transporter receptor subunit TctC